MDKAVEKDNEEPIWKQSQKSKDDRRKVLLIFVTLIVIIIVAIAVFIYTLPPVTKTVYSDLELTSIQTLREDEYIDENTTRTDLDVIIYLTNDGDLDSGEIKIDAYIKSYDTRNVETACNSNDSVTMDIVEKETTGKTNLKFEDLIIKYDERYNIDFLIWEDNKVVEEASTTIKVPFVQLQAEPDVNYSRDADDEKTGKDKKEEEAKSVPGFEIIPGLIALFTILFIIKRRRYKRKN